MSAPRQYYDDGLVQLDREAITLRRYHFPSGTSKVIPLRSIRGYTAKPLGQLGSAPLAAAGCAAAAEVDADNPRRAGDVAESGVYPGRPEGVHRDA